MRAQEPFAHRSSVFDAREEDVDGRRRPVAEAQDRTISRDRGRLVFAFVHNEQLVQTWTPIHKCKQVLALRPGAEVEVLFDPDRPTHAIVKHLYQA